MHRIGAAAPESTLGTISSTGHQGSYQAAQLDDDPGKTDVLPVRIGATDKSVMPLFRLTGQAIEQLAETSFANRGVKERGDLQRLLKANISAVADDVLILAEEFDEWDESRRRIDLLGIDRDANLVVFELKRDADGGHMELQA